MLRKAVQHLDRVFDPGQIDLPILRLIIGIFQLEDTNPDGLHRADLQLRRPPILHLAQAIAEVPLDQGGRCSVAKLKRVLTKASEAARDAIEQL